MTVSAGDGLCCPVRGRRRLFQVRAVIGRALTVRSLKPAENNWNLLIVSRNATFCTNYKTSGREGEGGLDVAAVSDRITSLSENWNVFSVKSCWAISFQVFGAECLDKMLYFPSASALRRPSLPGAAVGWLLLDPMCSRCNVRPQGPAAFGGLMGLITRIFVL